MHVTAVQILENSCCKQMSWAEALKQGGRPTEQGSWDSVFMLTYQKANPETNNVPQLLLLSLQIPNCYEKKNAEGIFFSFHLNGAWTPQWVMRLAKRPHHSRFILQKRGAEGWGFSKRLFDTGTLFRFRPWNREMRLSDVKSRTLTSTAT